MIENVMSAPPTIALAKNDEVLRDLSVKLPQNLEQFVSPVAGFVLHSSTKSKNATECIHFVEFGLVRLRSRVSDHVAIWFTISALLSLYHVEPCQKLLVGTAAIASHFLYYFLNPQAMKLVKVLGLLTDLRLAWQAAFMPTVYDIVHKPSLLFSPTLLSQRFMAYVWDLFGDGTDNAARVVKMGLILPYAHGVVLDIGAGHGHTVGYLDRSRVTKYIALEPNTRMHSEIRKRAMAAGFTEDDSSLQILPHGAQDAASICTALGGNENVDTLISILTLCSIPSPDRTLRRLLDSVLKPGGSLLFYEHVQNPRKDVAWWQWFWTPLWQIAFDGCRLDQPTHLWIDAMPMWGSKEMWGKEGEDVESLFWHRVGRFVKKSG